VDIQLRQQILRALIKDAAFLKGNWQDITAPVFPEREEQLIAKTALTFYEKYREPIGGMIRSDTETLAGREHLSPETRKKLKIILDTLLSGKMELVSVKALTDRVKSLKKYSFYTSAVEEVLDLEHKGELDASAFEKIVARANRELHADKIISIDYATGLEKRIARRRLNSTKKYPLLMIDALDERIKAIGRGNTGMILAPFSSGKGLFLVHLDIAYAMQGWNVLHITLEDPLELVEDRLDACLTGLSLNKLHKLPKTLRRRFELRSKLLHARIQVVDGTGGENAQEWTVAHIERVWRDFARDGFIADAIIVDYDEYLSPSRQFKGESARRFEFDDIYRGLTNIASKLNVLIWTAAQGTRASEGKWVVTGKDASEDISKIRKVFLAIGIGSDEANRPGMKYLYVCRHRLDRSRFGVEIYGDFEAAIFYDRPASLEHYKKQAAGWSAEKAKQANEPYKKEAE
jgi:hypothetical protein